jgi:hypothetical protein
VTPDQRTAVPAFQRELDPLLLLPVRLFVACLLADTRWCDDVAVQGALRLDHRRFTPHVELLNAAGYMEIRTKGRRTTLRLTALGLDRLTDHVTALHKVTNAAAELLTAQHVARSHPVTDAVRPPPDSL